ncbi:MAG: hypothetical protein JKY09_04815, partial [Crocinitomicaceae bacterium]|nr:hypothetical protein [Crocinitomicaceae bacterium]
MNYKFKLSLLYFSLIIFFNSCTEKSIIIDGYTDKSSYQPGDTFQLYFNSIKNPSPYNLNIYDINGKVVRTVLSDAFPQKKPSEFAYENEHEYLLTLKNVIPELKTGIYLFDNKIPFFVGSSELEKPVILDGYTDKFSYQSGDTLQLYVNSNIDINSYKLEINDINGKIVKTILCRVFPQKKPGKFAYENGFEYQLTLKSIVPKLKSGIYLFDNKIPFLVRSNKKTDILILYSSNTENAYCKSGGKNMYSYDAIEKKHPPKVSFLRPIGLPTHSKAFLRWINTFKDFNIGYLSDMDLDNYANIKDAKLLIIPG